MSAEPAVELREVGGGVLQVTLQDRENKNTFSPQLMAGLVAAFDSVRTREDCRAVVLTGYDSYFCSGGTQESLTRLHEGKLKFSDSNLYSLPLVCDVPVIAAMQGHGIGGGLAFGLFCDVIVLSRESIYTANFMRYGFTPGMGATCILPEKLGASLASEMLIGARRYRGEELARRGVPFAVLPRAEVLPHALQLAAEIAEKPRASLITLKAHLVRDLRARLPQVIEREVTMHDITFRQPQVKARIDELFGN